MVTTGAQVNTTAVSIARGDGKDHANENPALKWFSLPFVNLPRFGASVFIRANDSIDNTRQRKEGSIVDLDAGASLDSYLSIGALSVLGESAFLTKFSSSQADGSFGWVSKAIGVSAGKQTVALDNARVGVGSIMLFEGYHESCNANGIFPVVTVTGTTTKTVGITNADAKPCVDASGTARIYHVGHKFASGKLTGLGNDSVYYVNYEKTSTFDPLGHLQPGSYIKFQASGRYDTLDGYARVHRVSADSSTSGKIYFDKVANGAALNTAITNGGNSFDSDAETVIFFGYYLRNVDRGNASWDQTTSVIEGHYQGLTSSTGDIESRREYLREVLCDSLSISVAATDLVFSSWSFIGTDVNPKLSDGKFLDRTAKRILVPKSEVFDATNSVVRKRIRAQASVTGSIDKDRDLVEITTSMGFTISNNMSPQKAVGVLGAEFQNIGMFDVGVSVAGVLTSPEYTHFLRSAEPATAELILENGNGGIAIDVPSLLLSGGDKAFPQNESINIQLQGQAFRDPTFGTSCGITLFPATKI